MAKQWYIVHTYSGHENKAKQALLERAKAIGKADLFDEVLIPEETVVEMVKGEKRTSKRKFFPGYILVRMELTDETWHIVRGTPKITGFVGGDKTPPPISDDEVARDDAADQGRRGEAEAEDPVRRGRERARGERPVRELLRLRRRGDGRTRRSSR